MPATITLLPRTNDLVQERYGFRVTQLTDSRWRITQPSGAVVAYLDRGARCWTISRMSANRRGFVELGAFQSYEDALESLSRM